MVHDWHVAGHVAVPDAFVRLAGETVWCWMLRIKSLNHMECCKNNAMIPQGSHSTEVVVPRETVACHIGRIL